MNPSLSELRDLLDRAEADGRSLTFWWRDDDAVRQTPELDRLLALRARYGVPVAIAAVPAHLEPSLAARLKLEPQVRVLVHGWAHQNHAPAPGKPSEFGEDRPISDLADDAGRARRTVTSAFGPHALPIFVPPWNRAAPSFIRRLGALGFRGISAFGPRRPRAGLLTVNTHLDPVDWRGTRSAVHPARLAAALAEVLEAAGEGRSTEPIGLLTHHLAFDEPLWSLSEALLELFAAHPAVRVPPLDLVLQTQDRH
jgi:hypothetical protein